MEKAVGHRNAFLDKYRAALGAVVFILLSFCANAQIFQYPNLGNFGTGGHRDDHDSVVYLPAQCGAPTGIADLHSSGFNGFGQKIKRIAILGDTCGHHVYWWDPSNSTWSRLDGGGAGTDSAIARGSFTVKSSVGTTIIVDIDTAALHGFFVRLSDSGIVFATPTQLASKQNQISGTGYGKWLGQTVTFLTPAQVTSDLNQFTTTLQGLVPPPGTTSGNALTDNGTWQAFLRPGDSTTYATFKRLYKTLDSLNLVMIHKGDSAGVGYTTLARTRKVIDSLGALISGSGTTVANSAAVIGITRVTGVATTAKRSDAADPVDTAVVLTHDSSARSRPKLNRVIYQANSWVSGDIGTTLTNNSSGVSVVANKLQFTGAGGYTSRCEINLPSAADHFKMYVRVVLGTIVGNNMGIGIGPSSINTYVPIGWLLRTNFVTGGSNNGFAALDYNYNGTYTNQSLSQNLMSASSGDTIIMILDRNQNTYSGRVFKKNGTSIENDASATASFTYAGTPPPGTNNTSKYAIWNFGNGSAVFTVDSISVTSTDVTNGVLFVGDSRIVGYGAGSYNSIIPFLVAQHIANIIRNAGGGDRCTEVLARINEIIALRPTTVYLGPLGVNDLGSGQSLATVQANYSSIVTQLQAAGIRVIILLPTYSSTTNQAALVAYLQATYPGQFIDLYTTTNFPGALQADGTHPTAAGYAAAASVILNSPLVPYGVNSLDYSGGGSSILNQTTLQPGSNFNISGVGKMPTLNLTASGSGSDVNVYNSNTTAGYGQTGFYPASGTNVASLINVFPRGTGQAGLISGFTAWNGDWPSSPASSWAYASLYSDGSFFNLQSTRNTGATAILPWRIYTGTNTNQFNLLTDGTTSFGDTSGLAKRFSYNSNLGSSFTKYSLIDKNYADSAIAAIGNKTIPFSFGTVTVTGGVSMSAATYNNILYIDATGGNVTLTVTFATTNQNIRIKRKDNTASTVTIQLNTGNIDGVATKTMAGLGSMSLTYDGTNAWIF